MNLFTASETLPFGVAVALIVAIAVLEGVGMLVIFPKFSRPAAGEAGVLLVRAAEAGVPLVVGAFAMVFRSFGWAPLAGWPCCCPCARS